MTYISINPAHRKLGQSNLNTSSIAYGFWRFANTDLKTAQAKVETALEVGITLMDHADVYGVDGGGAFGAAEQLFGEVLRVAPSLRDQMVIATKGGIVLGEPYNSSPQYLRAAVEASLSRLQVDVIDLYQIHRPDFLGHPARVAEVLTTLRDEGKIKEVGVSNYTPSQFNALQRHLSFPIITHQPEFSCWSYDPLYNGILDQCMEHQVTPLAWSPLAGGRLCISDQEARSHPKGERLSALIQMLDQRAQEQEVSRSALAIAWTMAHPSGVIPIIGTQRIERIKDCMDALKVRFTRAQWNQILVIAQGEPLP